MAMMNATIKIDKQVSPMEILANRKARKEAGMVGCLGRKPAMEYDFYGYRDVQCWNVDIKGRFPDQEGYDYTNPNCFCFDCRGAFDSEGITDAELVNAGNPRACFVYGNLVGKEYAEEEADVESYECVEGKCQDCAEKEATMRFNHLDGRRFYLCEGCFGNADHEDDYLAHVEPPRPRKRLFPTPSLSPGFSNEAPAHEEEMSHSSLPQRSNGGGIQSE